jgi:4-aminobutyrate aminotransferase
LHFPKHFLRFRTINEKSLSAFLRFSVIEQEESVMNKNDIIRKDKEYIFPAVFHYYDEPLVISKGKGLFLYDIEGNKYLDFFGGVLTVSLGHCNEEISGRVADQVKKLQHASTLYVNEETVAFAEKLAQIAPGNLKKSFITNSGTEANETAIMAAKMYTGNDEVVSLRYSYHGRSILAMNMTGHHAWKMGYSHIPGIHHTHNAYCFRCPFGREYPDCEVRCAENLEELILTQTNGKIAALIAEPIQGVGGFITPPKEYFEILYNIVKKHGGLFICDEVQTGFGRTGEKWWGIEHYGVQPDIITLAKTVANGAPCGVTVTTDEIADSYKGITFSTFGGNPVSSVAGLATIEYIEKYDLVNRVKVVGDHLISGLKELKEKFPSIGEVRGKGLIVAMEIVKEKNDPNPELTAKILQKAKDNGLLLGKAGLYNNALRMAPHLISTKKDIEKGLGILYKTFEEVCK